MEIFDELESKRKDTRFGIPRAEGEALYSFIKGNNIKRVIETGINWGFSSYYILAALPDDGELISVELHKAVYTGIVVPAEWHKKWKIIIGSSQDKLRDTLLQNAPIDLFFHDSDHSYTTQLFEYITALPLVKFIGSHDIKLMGPPYAWDRFVTEANLDVIVRCGQTAFAQRKPYK